MPHDFPSQHLAQIPNVEWHSFSTDVIEEKTLRGEGLLDLDVQLVRPKNIDTLNEMLEELEGNIGRAIVHGQENGDSTEDIVQNIMSDLRLCLIDRWAARLFPKRYRGMHPANSRFPDDDLYADAYESAGFPLS